MNIDIHCLDHIKARPTMYIGDDCPDKLHCFLMGLWFGEFGFYERGFYIRDAAIKRGHEYKTCGIVRELQLNGLRQQEVIDELIEIFKEAYRIKRAE